MKKSIIFGALAFFAISAMSVQNVQAQDNTKKNTPTTSAAAQKPAKPVVTTNQESKPTASKACDAKKCADAQNCTAKKAESKSCCDAEKKAVKPEAKKAVKPEAKKAGKPEAKKATAKKAEKAEK